MDVNHVEASLSFPSFPRFCGQTFLERKDKELARPLREGLQRLDVRRVVRRLRRPPHPAADHRSCGTPTSPPPRCAATPARGGHAVCFTEIPPFLGLPSVHDADGYWDPFFEACAETEHRHLHAHRLVVEDAVDVGRRAARGRLDAHVHERGDVDHRLPHVAACSSGSRSSSSRTPRARSAGSPTSSSAPTRCGRTTAAWGGVRRQGACARRRQYYYGARLRLLLRRPARAAVARGGRRRQHHVRDRLPAQRLDVADTRRRSPRG